MSGKQPLSFSEFGSDDLDLYVAYQALFFLSLREDGGEGHAFECGDGQVVGGIGSRERARWSWGSAIERAGYSGCVAQGFGRLQAGCGGSVGGCDAVGGTSFPRVCASDSAAGGLRDDGQGEGISAGGDAECDLGGCAGDESEVESGGSASRLGVFVGRTQQEKEKREKARKQKLKREKEKRDKEKKRFERERLERESGGVVETVSVAGHSGLAAAGESSVEGESVVAEVVPEWRRAAKSKSVGVKSPLQSSLEAKWAAQNAVAELKAKQELELLQKRDLQKEAKMRDRKVQKVIDRSMVQIEKDHAFLAKTGNVPELSGGGFCKTVVDGEGSSVPGLSSGTISPNSSISEKEVREMMKRLADLEAENAVYRRKELVDGRLTRMVEGSVDFTVGSDGEIPAVVMEQAGEQFEGPEFLKVGPIVGGKRSLAFDREEFSYSGNYSKHYWD